MKHLTSFALIITLFGIGYAQEDTDALIASIFGKPANATADCECVEYYLCKDDGTINTNGEGIIDLRSRTCEDYLQVCCNPANKVDPPPTTPTPPINPTRTSTCGVRNINGLNFRIVAPNDEAEYGEFPWMVALLTSKTSGELFYKCGGALIHPKVVLTAAHCINNKKDKFTVRAGEWDTQRTTEQYPHQNREAEKVIIHPDFYSGALHNDIGIVILKEPFNIAPNVDVVCLPQQGATFDERLYCAVSGWGEDVFGKQGVYQAILKKVELPLVNRKSCQQSLRTTRLSQRFILDESFICAGGEANKDTCKGDGGSPLVCPVSEDSDVYQLAGLVSFGIGCGQAGIPALYANVPLFRNWIDDQLKNNNISL